MPEENRGQLPPTFGAYGDHFLDASAASASPSGLSCSPIRMHPSP